MQRWTGKAAFNLARVASSQLSEGDGTRVCVSGCICASVSVLVCLCMSMRRRCRSISGEVNQQAAQL